MQRPLVVNLGTIYDSQDLPQQILPDRQPEDWEVGLAAEQSPLEAQVAALEAQVAETSLDSADEEVECAGTPVKEAPEVSGDKWDFDVRLKAAHSRVMKMDDVETLRAKTTAQQHPRFLQFMIEMKEYMTDETDCLVLWDVWCTFYELSLQGKSANEIVSMTTPVERHTTKENIKKFFSPDTYRKKKNAQEQVAAEGTTHETNPEHEEHPCPTPKDPELPEVPLLTAAAQRRLRAEKAESSKWKGKGSKAKKDTAKKAKKDSKAKKKKGKNARKSKKSRKGRKANRALKAKRAREAEEEQSRKKHESHEEGKQQQHDRAPQLVSKDEQAILKKKPECEISTLLRTLSCIYKGY
eukprot:symbB.v1.2.009742.t2/scaffold626.1/size179291/4